MTVLLGFPVLSAQELPPGLPPEMTAGTAPSTAVAPVPAPSAPAPSTPVTIPSAQTPIPGRVTVDHYGSIWQRSPFELSIQAANAAPTGIAADWLLTSLSRVNGEPVAIVVNKTNGETAVVKMRESSAHNLRLVSADIKTDYRQSKVKIARGTEEAELIFQEQDLSSLASLAPAAPAPGNTNPANPVNPAARPPGTSAAIPGLPAGTSSTPRPPRRLIIRPKPVTPPPNNP
ncbi:MAG: hypothetical protein SFU85_11195 [Candidatus Methylacidiphilales bacterium]|nr:hypothetical protein [Candidatus Methylacidiphilales bacterium]